jgi:mRNA-capping enzyme
MICAYLIEKLNYTVDNALEYFSDVRPPGIYRQLLVNGLYERYGNRKDAVPKVTEIPFWKNNEEEQKHSRNSRQSSNS